MNNTDWTNALVLGLAALGGGLLGVFLGELKPAPGGGGASSGIQNKTLHIMIGDLPLNQCIRKSGISLMSLKDYNFYEESKDYNLS